jgi:hypothetical protein
MADDAFRIRVHIEDDIPRLQAAKDEALRCVVADFALAYGELGRAATRVLDGLLPEEMADADVEELANRIARQLVAWWMVAKAGERAAALESLEFSELVDAVFDEWAKDVGQGAG